uniref:Peptidase A2 domain-containing protein n=1 Tax=Athene cunicularia TaxID=194338 RepID=A0A663NE43_ATHCN
FMIDKFLVDTGATYPVLNSCKMPVSKFFMPVISASGQKANQLFFQPLKFALDAQVFMLQREAELQEVPLKVEDAVIPIVWAREVSGKSKRAEKLIDLKPRLSPVRIKQHPLKLESRNELVTIIQKFLNYKLLVECESKYNNPLLLVKKANCKEYQLVQDLRAINQITQDIHLVVAKPCTLLQTLTDKQVEYPETVRKPQYTWTALPQGFKNSPTIFGNQLGDKVSPQPPLLQTKQSQFPQPLLIGHVFQTFDQLRSPSLDMFE